MIGFNKRCLRYMHTCTSSVFNQVFVRGSFSIARNESRQNARLRSTSRLVFDEGKSASVMTSDSKDSPFEIYARKEMSEQLWQTIATLPAKYRPAIELFIGEKSLAETESELGISSGTVKTRRFRARRELCRLLTKSAQRVRGVEVSGVIQRISFR